MHLVIVKGGAPVSIDDALIAGIVIDARKLMAQMLHNCAQQALAVAVPDDDWIGGKRGAKRHRGNRYNHVDRWIDLEKFVENVAPFVEAFVEREEDDLEAFVPHQDARRDLVEEQAG